MATSHTIKQTLNAFDNNMFVSPLPSALYFAPGCHHLEI